MFEITQGNFKKQKFGKEAYLLNWPMLYILENGKDAYIGESNHVKKRMKQHYGSLEKKIFQKVHFIYSDEFNQSVTFDYESKLIQYITADEIFRVRNKNAGIVGKDYCAKKAYDDQFYKLWNLLLQKKIVKHSLEELEQSDLFKYSPFKELNDDQREAVEAILGALLENQKQKIIVNGMPGSGKTIVAVYLMKYLKDSELFQDKKIGFVVPQTSLRKTMRSIFKSVYGLRASDILSPLEVTKQKYDILLVDEAHRLHRYKNISYMGPFKKSCERIGMTTDSDELDWIMEQCTCPVLFYDEKQVVGPSGIDVRRFKNKMKNDIQKRASVYFTLMTQMRVQGGNDYIRYIDEILHEKQPDKLEFDTYEFKIVEHFGDFERIMYQKEQESGLARMVAGYAWDWVSRKGADFDMELEGIRKKWNHCTAGWVHTRQAVEEVGCIHSIQGYDLNYAFVIVGNEISYDEAAHKLVVKPECYYDLNGKKTAGYEELLEYIRHIYYVLMTRGIKGTYLYVCNESLKKYLLQFIDKEM